MTLLPSNRMPREVNQSRGESSDQPSFIVPPTSNVFLALERLAGAVFVRQNSSIPRS